MLWFSSYTISVNNNKSYFLKKQTNCENSKFKIGNSWNHTTEISLWQHLHCHTSGEQRRMAAAACRHYIVVVGYHYDQTFQISSKNYEALFCLLNHKAIPIRIHKTTFKLLYFIIFIQNMIFIVILNHVSIILDRKRPHNFQTKFENSGHSGTQEATERHERSGTTFARQPQAHQWETRTFNRPYVCPKNNGMLHMCRILRPVSYTHRK